MRYQIQELDVKSKEGFHLKPCVTSLRMQAGGYLLCGLAFSDPLLLKLNVEKKDRSIASQENLELERLLGDSAFGVLNGLQSTRTGDSVFSVMTGGMLPSFLKFLSKDLGSLSMSDWWPYLESECGGGMGLSLRHSIVQIHDEEFKVRRHKEPGAVLDVFHLGDYIFGLTGGSIWREPYLKSEKREDLRNDLDGNKRLHRDPDGYFWFLNNQGRLLRLGLMDIRAKPTPLRLKEMDFSHSAASSIDSWLYAVSGKTLLRIRRNQVTQEEELQEIQDFDDPISSVQYVDSVRAPQLLIATETSEGAKIYQAPLEEPEDLEMIPDLPKIRELGIVREIKSIGAMEVSIQSISEDKDKAWVWLAENRLGDTKELSERPKIANFSL